MIMPQMGESITEATISRWLKNPGDSVKQDEIILEISTDKVDSEIPAPATGILKEILANEGDVVPVKSVIARIFQGEVAPTKIDAAKIDAGEVTAPDKSSPKQVEVATPESKVPEIKTEIRGGEVKFVSPVVKSLAEKHGIDLTDLAQISGSGQGGRVTKQDFFSFIEDKPKEATINKEPSIPQEKISESAPPVAKKSVTPTLSSNYQALVDSGEAKVVPMDTMRSAIAEHMVRSKHTSPHVYSIQEVDVTNIVNWRAKQKDPFQKSEGFNLTFTPFFLEAATKALLKFPLVNSSIEGRAIITKKHINLGCAVALPNSGLIVPVIKRAEEKNLVGLARSLNDLGVRARNKKLLPDDVQGGTFSVTNPGMVGTLIGTPIINQPQVAILFFGAIQKRPVVIDDMIAIRSMCYLTLSYDHRLIDGMLGGMFLKFVCEYLEGWDMTRGLS